MSCMLKMVLRYKFAIVSMSYHLSLPDVDSVRIDRNPFALCPTHLPPPLPAA